MQYLEPTGRDLALAGRSRSVRPELLPPYPYAALPGVDPATASTATFQDFFRALRKRKWMIFAFVAVAASCAIALQLFMPKVYEGVALVEIGRHMNSIDTQPNSSGTPADDMDQIITTEMELAVSDPVLRPVAQRFNLWQVEKQTKGMLPDEAAALVQAPVELRKLKIKRPPNSYLLQVIYRATNRQLAADVANAVAESLAAHSNDSARKSLVETSSVVSANLTKMRAKMDEADNELASYERELGVVDPEQRATVLSSRLKDLTTALTVAQADRASREATLTQVKRMANLAPQEALAAAQVSDALGMPYASGVADTLNKLNEAKAHFASVKAFYGTEHPEYTRAREQVEELQRQVAAMVAGAGARAEIAYDQAVSREGNLQALVAATKSELDSMDAKAGHYDQLREEAQNYRKFYNDLESRATIADINKSFDDDTVELFSKARAPEAYIFPKLFINLPVALVIGLLVGSIAAILMDAADSRFSGPGEVAQQLRLDVLATVPESKTLAPITGGRAAVALTLSENDSKRVARRVSQYREAIRALRTAINLSLLDGSIRTVQVTSSIPGEGKTTTCASLAASYSQAGKRVLVVDADMRRPNIHRCFGIPSSPGLSEVLQGQVSYSEAINKIEGNVSVLPAGPATGAASELVILHLGAILAKAAREYDLVLVDSPPVQGAAEALELARMVDATLLVIHAEKTEGPLVGSTVAALRRARGNLLGVVMNRVRSFGDGAYGYSYKAETRSNDSAPLPANMVAADAQNSV